MAGKSSRRFQGLLIGLLAGVSLLAILANFPMGSASTATHRGVAPLVAPLAPPARLAVVPVTTIPALSLGVAASPHTICAFGISTCNAGVANGRVTLTANAGTGGVLAWPNVEVAFVVETTLYDGVYDPNAGDPGKEPCATAAGGMPCEESNGVPFFVAHAQQIANAISSANPHSHVKFAMVDYFYTCNWDDCDGQEYHVDIQNFVDSSYFGEEVTSTFQSVQLGGGYVYGDSDFSDNFLHSSAITAMYGTIIGSGLDWSNNTHHVIVWMGSSAPRDPHYVENYCVSGASSFFSGGACLGATCEPAYSFQYGGSSPNCEGWVQSQDGNATHSIAGLAHTAPACTGSIGAVCTIDTIDLWTTPTDPLSHGWPTGGPGYGPGGSIVMANVNHVLLAGCDMAAATGGTWNGPTFFTCPNGQSGGLSYVPHGPASTPNTANPTLQNAFRQIGFGPVLQTQVASGTGRPLFTYVPFGNIVAAPNLQATAACTRGGTPLHTCQTTPTLLKFGNLHYLGWNWSTNKTTNVMYVGDTWTASFNIIATGPPYASVPVDSCTLVSCKAAGSTSVDGLYTSASYIPYTNNSVVTLSFPLAMITVQFTPPPGLPPIPPPTAPPVPPGIPILTAPALPVVQPIGVGNTVGVANISLQATAAGFLGAGFMRVSMKNRPIAMKVAAKTGPTTSKFDAEAINRNSSIGHFE